MEPGVSAAQAARELDVHENVLHKWMRELTADPQQAFPDHDTMKPELAEVERLKREVAALRMERDLLKSRSLLRQGVDLQLGFVVKRWGTWPANLMCDALGVSSSGFYACVMSAAAAISSTGAAVSVSVTSSTIGSTPVASTMVRCIEKNRQQPERPVAVPRDLGGCHGQAGAPQNERGPVASSPCPNGT